eukprot:1871193-Pleurochrysis_carterae.AAC.2
MQRMSSRHGALWERARLDAALHYALPLVASWMEEEQLKLEGTVERLRMLMANGQRETAWQRESAAAAHSTSVDTLYDALVAAVRRGDAQTHAHARTQGTLAMHAPTRTHSPVPTRKHALVRTRTRAHALTHSLAPTRADART